MFAMTGRRPQRQFQWDNYLRLHAVHGEVSERQNWPVCAENLYPRIAVMESAEDGERFDASSSLDRARSPTLGIEDIPNSHEAALISTHFVRATQSL
jgi:hypothetical protein